MKIHTLPTGEPVLRDRSSIVVPFAGKRRVLSTCPLNGGYREDLTAVFNHDENPGAGMSCTLKAPTYEEHMALIAEEIGLHPASAAGMSTAASMENVSIQTERFADLAVTAVVTGGIEINAGRVGDPADWYEVAGTVKERKPGTINIMLFLNTDISLGGLTRALVTCTEAKTAALQELVAPSRYSMGLATGSGTDGTIVVCNAESDIRLTDAGKHSKLGELIGRCVKAAVKEALQRQTGLCPQQQHNVLRRLERFGITEQSLWQRFREGSDALSRADFSDRLFYIAADSRLVVGVSLYVHLLDQLLWELLTPQEAAEMGDRLLEMMGSHHLPKAPTCLDRDTALAAMLERLSQTLNEWVIT